LAFYDCSLSGNEVFAGMGGGAIISMGGELRLERVAITDNRATDVNRGVIVGGGVAVMGGIARIRDSIISANRVGEIAPTGFGGGIAYGGGIYVAEGARVYISGSTVGSRNPLNSGTSGNRSWYSGGGIANFGFVRLTDSAVIANRALGELPEDASFGGGISNDGVMRIKNVTVAASQAGTGGGIWNLGTLVLKGATVVHNEACQTFQALPFEGACGGGGVWNEGWTVSVRSLFANNTLLSQGDPLAVGPDCSGKIRSHGHNAMGDASGCVLLQPMNDQVGVDPRIGELQDNGEPGNEHFPLLPDSPLIDSGGPVSTKFCTFTDQIGQPRTDANGDGQRECDIGAIEFQVP
jgi:hypothetical protein